MLRARSSRLLPLVTLLSTTLALACGKGEEKPAEKAEEAKTEEAKTDEVKRDPDTSLDKVATATDLSGPVPPETSMVFFTIDGALIPVGCFNKDKNKLGAGKECLALAPEGASVYLKSAYSDQLDTIGAPKNALCEPGVEKPTSLSTPATDSGAAFDWAASPKSAGRGVVSIPAESWDDALIKFSDDEKKAVKEAIAKINGATADQETNMHQAASLDLDGDGKDERVFSAYVVNPRDTARYLFSGVFVAPGGDVSGLLLVEKTKTNSEIFKLRAAADLNGDGRRELWINAAFDEGGGDRMYQWKGSAFEPLGKWTCGM